jgi:galactokinase
VSSRLFVPGRIEVLGKHTDYAGGRSLLAATEQGFTVSAEPEAGTHIRVVDRRRQQSVQLDAATGETTSDVSWAVYPSTVVRRLARDFPDVLGGCRIELSSTLPRSAGLSSSSALITAVFLALDAVFHVSDSPTYRSAIPDREALAGYLGAVERGSPFPGLGEATAGVGTRGGSEDHVAILCAEPDTLVRYRFEPVSREGTAPVPAGHVFVVASSGVQAEKKGDARDRYNRLSDLAARAAQLWRSSTGEDHPHLGAILATPGGLGRLRDVIWRSGRPAERDDLRRRVRHFAAESGEIVPAAAEALAAGDLAAFGSLVDRSQALAEELLGNQVPETIQLARLARELGAPAASALGAGFGGSVWALAPRTDAAAFLDTWRERYLAAFPERTAAKLFVTGAGRAAGPV